MSFKVIVHRDVIKEAKKKLSKAHQKKLAEFIKALKENPIPIPEFDIRPVKGKKKIVRGIVLDLVIIEYFWKEKVIIVLKIEPRERAYSRR